MLLDSMSDRECRELLGRTNLGRLACSFNDQPYVVPVHIDFSDGCLYCFSMLGQKIEWMRANPLVCIEVDELTSRRFWESVVIFGRYEELTDTPEYAGARQTAERLFQRHPNWWQPATASVGGTHQTRPAILFRIVVSRMTGRRARPDDVEIQAGATEPPAPKGIRRWLRFY